MVYTIHTRPDGTKYRTLDVSEYERKVQAKLAKEAEAAASNYSREDRDFNDEFRNWCNADICD